MSDKIRVRLLNDGGYGCMNKVEFPAEVEAYLGCDRGVYVDGEILVELGAMRSVFGRCDKWVFIIGRECEVIE